MQRVRLVYTSDLWKAGFRKYRKRRVSLRDRKRQNGSGIEPLEPLIVWLVSGLSLGE